jgi:hypothetical protein
MRSAKAKIEAVRFKDVSGTFGRPSMLAIIRDGNPTQIQVLLDRGLDITDATLIQLDAANVVRSRSRFCST